MLETVGLVPLHAVFTSATYIQCTCPDTVSTRTHLHTPVFSFIHIMHIYLIHPSNMPNIDPAAGQYRNPQKKSRIEVKQITQNHAMLCFLFPFHCCNSPSPAPSHHQEFSSFVPSLPRTQARPRIA